MNINGDIMSKMPMIIRFLTVPIVLASITALFGITLLSWLYPEFIFLLRYAILFVFGIAGFLVIYNLTEERLKLEPIVAMIVSLITIVMLALLLQMLPFSLILIIVTVLVLVKIFSIGVFK